VSGRYLAFDLGAHSGRAMLGELRAGVLSLTEVCRFLNEPVRVNGTLRWDVLRLWLEMTRGLGRVSGAPLESIGVDTWGCDYGLIGEQGNLLENPYHYRDHRADHAMPEVFKKVPRERIYASTGSQFLSINTLYQLYAACQSTPHLIQTAQALLAMPDLFNYWLTGRLTSEYTIASTSQLVDARSRAWATGLMVDLDLPVRLFQPLVEPGTVIGELRRDVSASLGGTPVVAPACHDTGSAFAAVSPDGGVFLSSGTWSLFGAEVAAPVISSKARDLNFTNEGGVCGTTRVLRNIVGMWLLQACVHRWAADGREFTHEELLAAASDEQHAFRSLFDPDYRAFFNPTDMPGAIAEFCRQTGQPEPDGPAGYTRAILESLAFKYRIVLKSLEEVTGTRYSHIRVVGGGSRNRLLNQFTADATGRPVVAGPVEATALGNVAMQMLATGAVTSLAEARRAIDRSFPSERFEPVNTDRWNKHYPRFQEYVELTSV
jgi:rhamnulokinase